MSGLPAKRVAKWRVIAVYILGLTRGAELAGYRRAVQQQPQPPWIRRVTRGQLLAVDALAALVLAGTLSVAAYGSRTQATLPAPVGCALAVLLCAAVAVRRLWPYPTLVVALAGSAMSVVSGFTKDPLLAVALVLYVTAAVSSPRAARAALAFTQGVITLTAGLVWMFPSQARPHEALATRVVSAGAVQFAAWLLGRAAANQRAFNQLSREFHERRVQQQVTLARAEVAHARQAVAHERLRIAQDLHDVVAHSMSVIAVQAGAGHHVAAQQPDKAIEALAAIESTSRDALEEMRRLLGMLRAPEELPPTPDLTRLPSLLEATRRAGVHVELIVQGERRRLPAGVELAAYRIVQEALTNVVKHAGTDHGRVVIDYRPQHLSIEVTDDGRGCGAQPTAGHGLTGIRERVAACGGRVTARPLPYRGFRVAAELPLSGQP